jgi:hypothetical protein
MKRKNSVLLQNVGGQDLLVPLGAKVVDMNGMVVLNPAGRFLWECLAEDRSLDDLVTAMVDHFDVDRETALVDAEAFVGEISRWGLLNS